MFMIYHFRPAEYETLLKPERLGLKYTSIQRIPINGKITLNSDVEELVLVVLNGEVEYQYLNTEGVAVFCDMLYIPINKKVTLTSSSATIIRYGAPCARDTTFQHICFEDVDNDSRHKKYGKVEDGNRRDVWNYIDESFDSSRFLVGMCHGAPGGWTAWPPHQHGDVREEVYVYFGLNNDFGVQCLYDDLESDYHAVIVQNEDLITIPKGYHPNVGTPKQGLRYIYCMVSVEADDRDFMNLEIQKMFGGALE